MELVQGVNHAQQYAMLLQKEWRGVLDQLGNTDVRVGWGTHHLHVLYKAMLEERIRINTSRSWQHIS